MSAAVKNDKSLIDDGGECNNNHPVMKWTNLSKHIDVQFQRLES